MKQTDRTKREGNRSDGEWEEKEEGMKKGTSDRQGLEKGGRGVENMRSALVGTT